MEYFDWNELDSRAFVPTPSHISSPDVFRGSVAGVMDSRSPLSMGVYVVENDNDFRSLDLIYVSNVVAEDRSRTSPPMPAGWYLPIEKEEDMGKTFEIRVTTRCKKIAGTFAREVPGADIAIHYLKVNGHVTRPGGHESDPVYLKKNDRVPCCRLRGFTESYTCDSTTSGHRSVRSFCFGKIEVTEEGSSQTGEEGNDFGTIDLEVESVLKGGRRTEVCSGKQYRAPTCASVSERSAMKKGATVALKQDGKTISEKEALVSYQVVSRKKVDTWGIRIHVRERSWLMSRRIVNSDGRPCTAGMAHAMETANAARLASSHPLQKLKSDPGEVIDLS